MADKVFLKTEHMELLEWNGRHVKHSELAPQINKQHNYLLENPDEFFMYTQSGNVLILSHRFDGYIETTITNVIAIGEMKSKEKVVARTTPFPSRKIEID